MISHRLSQNSQVLLLESGPKDTGKWDSWKIQMPAALTMILDSDKYNYQYYTEEQVHLNNRKLHWPRGRCLGKSKKIFRRQQQAVQPEAAQPAPAPAPAAATAAIANRAQRPADRTTPPSERAEHFPSLVAPRMLLLQSIGT